MPRLAKWLHIFGMGSILYSFARLLSFNSYSELTFACFFVGIALCSLPLLLSGVMTVWAKSRIERAGGRIEYIGGFVECYDIILDQVKDPFVFKWVPFVEPFESLSLVDSAYSDEFAGIFRSLTRLESLNLAGTQASLRTFEHLCNCRNLTFLSVFNLTVSESSLSAILNLRSVETLDVTGAELPPNSDLHLQRQGFERLVGRRAKSQDPYEVWTKFGHRSEF